MQQTTPTNFDAPEEKNQASPRQHVKRSANGSSLGLTPRKSLLVKSHERKDLQTIDRRARRSMRSVSGESRVTRYALHLIVVLLVIGSIGFFGATKFWDQNDSKVASQLAADTTVSAATVEPTVQSSEQAYARPSSDTSREVASRGGRTTEPTTLAEEKQLARAADVISSGPVAIAASATAIPSQEQTATPAPTEQETPPADQGQVATLPEEPTPQEKHEIQSYTVQPGDTLYGIASSFGISIDTVLWANNLDESSVIQPGDQLTILPTSGIKYEVQPGDSLNGIAQEYGVDAGSIASYNNISDPGSISIGQSLIIPGASPKAAAPAPQNAPAPAPQAAPEPPAPAPAPAPAPREEPKPVQQPAPAPQPAQAPAPAPAPVEEPAPAPAPSSNVGQRIVDTAMQYIGVPYVWGGASPSGFDCTGFTYYVYKKAGVPIPRSAEGQAASGPKIARGDLLPGDLVLFQGTYKAGLSHAGIYIGNGQFVHAVTYGVGVKVDALDSSYYKAHWWGGVRPW